MGIFTRKPKSPTLQERPFECKRSGLTIRGTEYLPPNASNPLPAAIVCHGFMANQDTVRGYAKLLAGLGYAAYCFDFCGGCVARGRSDGATTDMSVLTEVRDLESVISFVRSLPYTNDTLLLSGCSQGGFVSALTAARHPAYVTGIVLFYPALCIPDDARAGKMMFARFDPHNLPETIACGPMKLGRCYPADVMDMDPFREISAYDGPVLIIHGTKDAIVSVDYAKRALQAYQSRKTDAPAFLTLIEGGAHGFSKKHDRIAMDALTAFAVRFKEVNPMSKKLVAYFSASGVTAKLAAKLSAALHADLYEIKPEVPYTKADLNWMDKKSRSTLEMKDPASRPAIAGVCDNIAQYDEVYVGFPIWWYVAPTIINTFLEAHDLAGKTVIPFATSGGSGMGKTNEKLQPSCPASVLKEGKVFSPRTAESELAAWAETL